MPPPFLSTGETISQPRLSGRAAAALLALTRARRIATAALVNFLLPAYPTFPPGRPGEG
jgi:hypothetical protein